MSRIWYNSIKACLIISLLISGCAVEKREANSIISIPFIENFALDGNSEEWAGIESYRLWADPLGNFVDTADFSVSLKAAWNAEGLLLQFEITDESFMPDTLNPWNGDALEIFLSPSRESGEVFQVSLVPGKEADFIKTEGQVPMGDQQNFSGIIRSVTKSDGNKRITEIEIDFLKNEDGEEAGRIPPDNFAMQVYADDADDADPGNSKLVWYPVGPSYNSSPSMFTINLSNDKQTTLKGSSRLVITDNEKVTLYVFGAERGDKIEIYLNSVFLKKFKSESKSFFLPDTIDLSTFELDTENDSVFVCINSESLFLHELILSPRIYEQLEPRRFEREIRNFIFMDRRSFPPKNASLFIGSSSIVRWQNLKNDFPELTIIKRGFGGSASQDALAYIHQIVLPYKPSEIIYYEGDNDIPMGLSPEEIRDNIKAFIDIVADTLPETRIYLLSPKPSINRMHLWNKYLDTHQLLKTLAGEYENVIYVDVAESMFDEKDRLNYSLFVEDGIHMNEKGYSIWTNVLRKAMETEN